jgi:hypothetical protein
MPDTDLQAGPEMDAAVALACGLPFAVAKHLNDYQSAEIDGQHKAFYPSRNIGCAFEAAEKVGLFAPESNVTMWRMLDGFRVAFDRPNGPAFTASTPAEAICRAILALANRPATGADLGGESFSVVTVVDDHGNVLSTRRVDWP